MTTLSPGGNVRPAVGILMLDTRFPRPPGDIGNPATFPFPVRYRVVQQATPERVVMGQASGLVDAFCEAARDLETEGAALITTSCGFLALHQQALAAAVSVPVFSSALLQVPLALAAIGPSCKLGVVTFKADALTPAHFAGVGVTALERIVTIGLEAAPALQQPILHNLPELDVAAAQDEVVAVATDLLARHPEIGGLVLECTNLPPYSAAIHRATGLPVWDVATLVRWAYAAVSQQPYNPA